MQEKTTSKKHRKEIREAVKMRKVRRKAGLYLAIIVIACIVAEIAITVGVYAHFEASNQVATFVPTFTAFAMMFLVVFQYRHYAGIRAKYQEYCIKHGVSDQDMREYMAASNE